MEECICGRLMEGKTRILVTHQTQFLRPAAIVVMENGKIMSRGYDEVRLFDSMTDDSELPSDEREGRNSVSCLISPSSVSDPG